jgi:hypothetical protein
MRLYSYGLSEMCAACIPLRLWVDGESTAYRGETLGIAPGHLIVKSPVELVDGMRLTLRLQMALDADGSARGELELFAWVLCTSKLPDGNIGAQLELERG